MSYEDITSFEDDFASNRDAFITGFFAAGIYDLVTLLIILYDAGIRMRQSGYVVQSMSIHVVLQER